MSGKKAKKILFFSKTLDFLERYLPEQSLKSRNTIETYRDALTVFRRYVTDTMNLSLRTFGFEECTHEFLLLYIEFLHKNGNSETTCNKTGLPRSGLIFGTLLIVTYHYSQQLLLLPRCLFLKYQS